MLTRGRYRHCSYQHLSLTLAAMVFALAQSPATSMSEASQGCVVWPLVVIIEESITVYDQMMELMFILYSAHDVGVASRVAQFQDQHRKLRRIWLQAKNNPLISVWVDPPVLDASPPAFDSEQARSLHAERKRARAEGGDPHDRVIAAQAQEIQTLRDGAAMATATIAALQAVNADSMQQLQQAAVAAAEAREAAQTQADQGRLLRERLEQLQLRLTEAESRTSA